MPGMVTCECLHEATHRSCAMSSHNSSPCFPRPKIRRGTDPLAQQGWRCRWITGAAKVPSHTRVRLHILRQHPGCSVLVARRVAAVARLKLPSFELVVVAQGIRHELVACFIVFMSSPSGAGHRTQRKTKRGKEGRRGGGAMQVCVPLKRLPSGTIAKSIAPLHATSLALLAAAAGECPFVPAPYYIRSLKVPS